MLLLALRFGTDKQVKAAAPRRPHVRIPKLMRYELRANIYQARDLQAADDNGLADPYVKVSLADPHPHPRPHPRPHPHPHPHHPHPHPQCPNPHPRFSMLPVAAVSTSIGVLFLTIAAPLLLSRYLTRI